MGDKLRRAALALLLVASCAVEPPVTVEVGTGESTFEPIGAEIHAIQGPQGGFHVFLNVRATGLPPGDPSAIPTPCDTPGPNPCVAFDVVDLSTGLTLDNFPPLRLALVASASAPGQLELPQSRLVPLAIQSLAEVDGHPLALTVTLGEPGSAQVSASVQATCVGIPLL